MSQLNVNCSRDFSDLVLRVEPTNKTPTLICRCLQALGEALKTNASVTNINLRDNKIGDEGAKACGVWWACHDVTFPTSCDSDKFGWFGGCSFIVHLGSELSCKILPIQAVCRF